MLLGTFISKHLKNRQFSTRKGASIVLSGRNKLPQPKLTRYHGRARLDPYQYTFLDQSTLNRFLLKEGEIYNNFQNKLWKARTDQYYRNTISRKDARNLSYPQQYDQFEYFTQVDWYQDRDFTTIYRKRITESNSNNKQLVLNIMKEPFLKKYHKTISLYSIAISSDHTHIAFGCDLLNKEQYTWFIRNIKTNEFYKWQGGSRIQHIIFLGEEGIFFSKLGSDGMQPKSVYYCSLQSIKQSNDKFKSKYQLPKQILIYDEDKKNCYISISQSKDHKYLFINSNTINKSQIYSLNIPEFQKNLKQNPQRKPKLEKILKFEQSIHGKSEAYYQENKLYFWKCDQNNHIITVKNLQQNKKIIQQKIVHRTADDQVISNVDIFKDKMVLYIKKVTKPILRVIKLNKFSIERYCQYYDVPLPYDIGIIQPGINKPFDPKSIIFTINNPFIYNESYEYNFQTNKVTLLEKFKLVTQEQLLKNTQPSFISMIKSKFIKSNNFQPSKFTAFTVDVPSQTGDFIPLTIIKNKKIKKRGKLLLNVYGSYGQSIEPNYVNHHLQALEKGWTIAYAHVRGGKQKGNAWYKAAKGNMKSRSWRDLAECVGYLLHNDYTHPSLLFLHGSSAGAITAFNAVNAHPHLYKGLIIQYPFVDVLSSLLNDNQGQGKDQLADTDYQEFGNPQQDLSAYNLIQSVSPYDNIHSSKQYPFLYIIGGMNDYRCPLFRIAKFVKKFRQITSLYNRNKNTGSLHLHKNNNPQVQVPRTFHDLSEKESYQQIESIMKVRYPNQINWNAFENINLGNEDAHHTLRRIKPIIPNNLILRIDKDGSHHGSANLHDQTYRDCDVFGFMDYLVQQGSNDCTYR